MSSLFFERLRAARKAADLTQAQMAAACGVTRSAYAFYESGDDATRVRPNVEQIIAISKLTKVPVEILLNDKLEVADVWRSVAYGMTPAAAPTNAGVQTVATAQRPGPDRQRETFWRATEYQVTQQDPSRSEAFDREVVDHPIPVRAHYLHGRHLVCLASRSDLEGLTYHLGRLLLVERLAHRTLTKHLLIWCRHGLTDPEEIGEFVHSALGVKLRQVNTADEAAAYLLGLS